MTVKDAQRADELLQTSRRYLDRILGQVKYPNQVPEMPDREGIELVRAYQKAADVCTDAALDILMPLPGREQVREAFKKGMRRDIPDGWLEDTAE